MQKRWVDEAEGNATITRQLAEQRWFIRSLPCEAPNEAHELVQVITSQPTNECADYHSGSSKPVLLPFDPFTDFTADPRLEESCFHYTKGREELDWNRQHDCERIDQLNGLGGRGLLRQIDDYGWLNA